MKKLFAFTALVLLTLFVPPLRAEQGTMIRAEIDKIARPATDSEQSHFLRQIEVVERKHIRSTNETVAGTETNNLIPILAQPSTVSGIITVFPKTSILPGSPTGFESWFWIMRELPVGTVLVKRVLYTDGSMQVFRARILNYDVGPNTGFGLEDMNFGSFNEPPIAVQVLVFDPRNATLETVEGQVRSYYRTSGFPTADSMKREEATLVIYGSFAPGIPIRVSINLWNIDPAAIEVAHDRVVIHPERDLYLAQGMIGQYPWLTVEQFGSCHTTVVSVSSPVGKGKR